MSRTSILHDNNTEQSLPNLFFLSPYEFFQNFSYISLHLNFFIRSKIHEFCISGIPRQIDQTETLTTVFFPFKYVIDGYKNDPHEFSDTS